MGDVSRQGMGVPLAQMQLEHQLQSNARASYSPLAKNNYFNI
jgi:hypothetical protein